MFGAILWFDNKLVEEVKLFDTKEKALEYYHNARLEALENGGKWDEKIGIILFKTHTPQEIANL